MFDLDENRPDYFDEPETDNTAPDRTPRPNGTIDFSADYSGTGEAAAPKPHRGRKALIWIGAVSVVVLAVIAWLRYFNPYATDAIITGYVVSVERRGIIFKTYEADFISEAALTDTARVYSRNVSLTIPSRAVALELQRLQGTGRRVSLVTERFHGMLPWRGGSTTVVAGFAQSPYDSSAEEKTDTARAL